MRIPERHFDVVEEGISPQRGRDAIRLGADISYCTDALRAYAFKRWDPVIYDALAVAAAIDYADRVVCRSVKNWSRHLTIRIPVHEVSLWRNPLVADQLRDAAMFLTGDQWEFEFVARHQAEPPPLQEQLELPSQTTLAVIPYSNGMDSKMVAGIMHAQMGDSLLRVRLGPRSKKAYLENGKVKPFAAVPYSVNLPRDQKKESSGRSRGFRFALISGLAAYLAEAPAIIVPESGQGALGPALVTVGGSYKDFRNHPRFTKKMEGFLLALLGHRVQFQFPRIWSTKAQTLMEFVQLPEGELWRGTRSCWYENNQSSVNNKYRPCGACAACMLRRMSVHAAGLEEDVETYRVIDLAAATIQSALAEGAKLGDSFSEYALAGTLSLAQLAAMRSDDKRAHVKLHATLISQALGQGAEECEDRLRSLIERHAGEWNGFVQSLGPNSFVAEYLR